MPTYMTTAFIKFDLNRVTYHPSQNANSREVYRYENDKMKIEPAWVAEQTIGRINHALVEARTETQMTGQIAQDEALAMQDSARVLIKVANLPAFDTAEYLKTAEDMASYQKLVLGEYDPAEMPRAFEKIHHASATKRSCAECSEQHTIN